MLKNKLLISAILITMCSCAMLASCGDGTRVEETNGTQATEKETNNIVEDIGSDIKDGAENIGNDIQNGMGDVEDATHGIVDDQNGGDSGQSNAGNENGGDSGMNGENGNNMPGGDSENARGRRHRSAVPFGK